MNRDLILDGFKRSAGGIVRTAALAYLVGLLLVGCIPITPEEGDTAPTSFCVRWSYEHWQNFDFGDDASVDDLLATVRKLYDVDDDSISIEKDPEGQTRHVNWTDNNVDYSASLITGDRLKSINVYWRSQPPTMAQLIDCLGSPERYYEAANDEGAEINEEQFQVDQDVSYWLDEALIDLYPGYVSPLIVEGVASPKVESSLQAGQPDHPMERLKVFVMPEQAYEAPGPSACARLSVSRWREFRFGVDLVGDVVATVIRLWDIDREKIEGGERHTEVEGFFPVLWSNNDQEEIYHAADFSPDGKLEVVSGVMIPGLALGQIIDCLRPPDYYIAFRGNQFLAATDLRLYYIEEGFSVRGISGHRWPWSRPLERISPEYGMSEFDVYPLSYEEIVHGISDVDGDGNPDSCILRVWPGSIEAMEIDDWPEQPARCD
ncbi:MAG: hypothetical protein OXF62_21955 [Caldilineaceae bacterium]|nr:hypothetical protein [Caldilineaceae bacterium]